MLMIGVGRKERKGREKMGKSGAIKRQGIKMSEEADWDNERQRGGLRAFIDGLAQPKREHKDKQMRHTHTKVEPARPGDTEQTCFVCVHVHLCELGTGDSHYLGGSQQIITSVD